METLGNWGAPRTVPRYEVVASRKDTIRKLAEASAKPSRITKIVHFVQL